MRKNICLLLAVLLFSCQTEEQKMGGQCIKTIEKSIRDQAFKENLGVQLLELQYVGRKEISENDFDSLRLAELTITRRNMKDVADLELQYANLLIEEATAKNKLATMDKKADPNIMAQAKAEIAEHTQRVKTYLDTIQSLLNEDSVTRYNISKRNNGGDRLYLVKYALKSTIGGHNEMDTLQAVFTKQLQMKARRLF